MTRVSWLWHSSGFAQVSQCSVARRRFMLALISVLACGLFLFTPAAWGQTEIAHLIIGCGDEGAPTAVAVNPVTNKFYVPFTYQNFQQGTCSGGLGVIDGATNGTTTFMNMGLNPKRWR